MFRCLHINFVLVALWFGLHFVGCLQILSLFLAILPFCVCSVLCSNTSFPPTPWFSAWVSIVWVFFLLLFTISPVVLHLMFLTFSIGYLQLVPESVSQSLLQFLPSPRHCSQETSTRDITCKFYQQKTNMGDIAVPLFTNREPTYCLLSTVPYIVASDCFHLYHI